MGAGQQGSVGAAAITHLEQRLFQLRAGHKHGRWVRRQLLLQCSAAVDGTSYRVSVRVNTSLGEVVNGDGVLKGLAKDDVPST